MSVDTAGLAAISPLITLTAAVLCVMMSIAFARNLALTALGSSIGLLLTLANIVWVGMAVPAQMVTPLIAVDDYALTFSGLIVLAAFFINLQAYSYHRCRGEKQDEFLMLLMLATLGAVTLAHSAHFASFILGLELLGVSLYAMISYPGRGLFSLEAALKYLILSAVSSATVLFGIALLFACMGTLSFAGMGAAPIDGAASERFVLIGFAMILGGVSFKLSLAPFHMWTPDVYEGAPAPATAFLATVSKGAIFAALLRFLVSLDALRFETILTGLFWLAMLSILFGNLLAVMQHSIKRILAYSSIAHLGYLMVALVAAGYVGGRTLAVEASVFFLVAYFATTVGAFGVVSILSGSAADHDTDNITDYAGLFWRRPMLAFFFSLMLLSLAGIPLTLGFVGKFYIFAAGVESGLWALIAAVVIGSGIGLFYYLRIIFTMTRRVQAERKVEIPAAGGWSLGAVSFLLLALGVYPAPVIDWVASVARTLG